MDFVSPFWQALTLPRKFRMFGLRVPPMSVWHVFALEQIGNTYMTGGALDMGDVVQALLVVTQSRRQFMRMFRKPSRVNAKARRIKRALIRWAARRKDYTDVDALILFRDYVETSMRTPGRWIKPGAKACAAPYALHALTGAIKSGVCVGSAWDVAYAQARVMFDVFAEQAGDDSIMTARAQEVDERMAMEGTNG